MCKYQRYMRNKKGQHHAFTSVILSAKFTLCILASGALPPDPGGLVPRILLVVMHVWVSTYFPTDPTTWGSPNWGGRPRIWWHRLPTTTPRLRPVGWWARSCRSFRLRIIHITVVYEWLPIDKPRLIVIVLTIRLWPRWFIHGWWGPSSSIKACWMWCILSVVCIRHLFILWPLTLRFIILFGQNFFHYCFNTTPNVLHWLRLWSIYCRCVWGHQFYWFLALSKVSNCLDLLTVSEKLSFLACSLK